MKLLQTLLLLGVTRCCAQFYAPPTDFHDPSQRLFPVEAARVIAWRSQDPKMDRVTFQVEQSAKGDVAWKISWIDAAGTPSRSATVK